MESAQRKALILFAIILVSELLHGVSQNGYAQEPAVPPAAATPTNSLTPKLQALTKNALKVEKEEDGIVYILIDKQSYAKDTEMLFVRPKGNRLETVATGQVGTEQVISGKKYLLIQIHRDSVSKYPKAGDFAVTMSDPMALPAPDKKNETNYPKPDDDDKNKKPRDPGYLEGGLGLAMGQLKTTTEAPGGELNQANDSKNPKPYRFKFLHFAYYSDYFPVGVEYNSYAGNHPTDTFYHERIKTDSSFRDISLYYRFRKFWGDHVRFSPRLSLLSDSFKTDNPDEHILTTNYSGIGLGARLSIDLVSDVWKPSPTSWFLALQRIYGEYGWYPSLSATDVGTSRGGNSTGKATDFKIGMTSLIYLNFIPLFKRWVLDGGYAGRSYNVAFSGSPTNPTDPGNTYQIPVGSTAKETDHYFYFFLGVRFEDPLYLLKKLPDAPAVPSGSSDGGVEKK